MSMNNNSLAEYVRPDRVLRVVAAIVIGSLLLTASARLQVPFWPVPMTLQTLAVLVIAMVLGPRLGGLVVASYVAEGLLGLPVFANTPERGAGLAYFFGPTGGYLAGFIVAAVLCGWLAERGFRNTLVGAVAANFIGTAVILLMGYAWLAVLIGPVKAFDLGVLPFALASVLKIALGGVVVFLIGRRSELGRWRP